jgi:transcriptional regulator with XRE-family HTH domain
VAKDGIHPVDKYVGQKLRLARTARKMSQTQLGEASGITFQQVQKYEKGTNRVSASRLFEFAKLLGVDISYFFDGASEDAGEPVRADVPKPTFDMAQVDVDILRALFDIKDSSLKKKLLALITSLPCEDGETGRRLR